MCRAANVRPDNRLQFSRLVFHRRIAINNCPCPVVAVRSLAFGSHRYSCGRKEISWIPESCSESDREMETRSKATRCTSRSSSHSRRREPPERSTTLSTIRLIHGPAYLPLFHLSELSLLPEGLLINDRTPERSVSRSNGRVPFRCARGQRSSCHDRYCGIPIHIGPAERDLFNHKRMYYSFSKINFFFFVFLFRNYRSFRSLYVIVQFCIFLLLIFIIDH